MPELAYAFRTLIHKPRFALLVVVTFGLGIGATTAIFSVTNAVLLKPLPYEDPEKLVFVWNRLGDTGVDRSMVAAPDVVDYQTRTEAFESIAAIFNLPTAITEPGLQPDAVNAGYATSEYFSVLGVDLLLGDMFGPEDEGQLSLAQMQDPNTELPVAPAILSYNLWQSRYGGDPGVLGRAVAVNGQSMIVRGVAPPGFELLLPPDAGIPARTDLWTPFTFNLATGARSTQWLVVFARLQADVTLADAQAEMDRIARWQRENFDFHRTAGMEIQLVPMHEDVTSAVRDHLIWFLVGAGFLLLLTFSNATNLLLLRAWERRRETSIRAALGGRPARLVAQVLVESLALAALGGIAGLLLAYWGIRVLLALQPENLPRVMTAAIDAQAFGVAGGGVLLATLACALLPAWQVSRIDLAASLQQRTATASPAHQWVRKALVVLEIAISLLLLVNTGLVLRTAQEIGRIDPGFRSEGVLTAKISLPFFKYPELQRRADLYDELLRHVATVPGVEAFGAGYPLPLGEGRQGWFGPWSVDGMNHEEWTKNEADYRGVMASYFETMGVRLVRGRFIETADNEPDASLVVVVDEIMARRAWSDGGDPVGKRLMVWTWDEAGVELVPVWATVVGVVAHVRDDDLRHDGRGTVFCPFRLYGFAQLYVTLRSASDDPFTLVGPLRAALHEVDSDLPLMDVRLMQEYVDDFLAPTRFALILFAAFASIAVLLAAVGLYGVITSTVVQRRHEIGVRMTFGAAQRDVVRLVLRQALTLVAWGLGLGVVAALLLNKGLAAFLYGVTPTDPTTFVAIVVAQTAIALVAVVVPAWRATQVDPVRVLQRMEG